MVADKELRKRNFSQLEAKTAQEWILFGNWQYKKVYNLELSDFFPTKDQLITTGTKYIPLQIAQEREKQLNHIITRLRAEIDRVRKTNEEIGTNSCDDDEKKRLVTLVQELMQKNFRRKALIEQLSKLISQHRILAGSDLQQLRNVITNIDHFTLNKDNENEQES